MFNFHKPKIYRSNLGCCICKAKSSSSRFTDSKKYENEFMRCFRLDEQRSGEICNACVLLVKRWKKLTPESRLTKHWHHVVDARSGPVQKAPARSAKRRLVLASSSKQAAQLKAQQQQQQHQHSQNQQCLQPQPSTSRVNTISKATNDNATTSNNNAITDDTNCHQDDENRQQQQQQSGKRARPLASIQMSPPGASNSSNATCNQHRTRRAPADASPLTDAGDGLNPPRRSYMTPASPLATSTNSTVFKEVLRRYRQRQQQDELKHARRCQRKRVLESAKQQQLPQLQKNANDYQTATASSSSSSSSLQHAVNEKQLPSQQATTKSDLFTASDEKQANAAKQPLKRTKRNSDSFSSICVDGFKVSSVLDVALWRKRKVCCGIVFIGLNGEVALFPKLYRPRSCSVHAHKFHAKSSTAQAQTSSLSSSSSAPLESQPATTIIDERDEDVSSTSGSCSSSGAGGSGSTA